jgi:hypothetical protein
LARGELGAIGNNLGRISKIFWKDST